jgi:hypothetical protein
MRRRSESAAAFAVAALAVLATGCQAAAQGKIEQPADARDPLADLAVDTLASELEIPQDKITVVSVAAVEWPDSSVGCPRPGRSYLTVITPGHKVLLKVEDRTYAVHEAKGKAVVCQQPSISSGAAGAGALMQDRLMLTARADLAKRLGVPVPEILAAGATPETFEDASLGCPKPGMQYAHILTEGWVLTLRHGDRDFTYHADAHHVIPCPDIAAE